jgi:hypothetical protein
LAEVTHFDTCSGSHNSLKEDDMQAKAYEVKAGDNWWTVADRFGTKPSVLLELNNRSVDSRLVPGEEIKVPDVEKLFLDVRAELPRFADLNKKLLTEKDFRAEFLKNPADALRRSGVTVDPELIPPDFPVLRLMDDEEFKAIVKKGDRVEARKYLRKNYPELMAREVEGATHYVETVDAVVDVGVAVPAVAVADPVV